MRRASLAGILAAAVLATGLLRGDRRGGRPAAGLRPRPGGRRARAGPPGGRGTSRCSSTTGPSESSCGRASDWLVRKIDDGDETLLDSATRGARQPSGSGATPLKDIEQAGRGILLEVERRRRPGARLATVAISAVPGGRDRGPMNSLTWSRRRAERATGSSWHGSRPGTASLAPLMEKHYDGSTASPSPISGNRTTPSTWCRSLRESLPVRAEVDGSAEAGPWLARITVNLSIDRWRRKPPPGTDLHPLAESDHAASLADAGPSPDRRVQGREAGERWPSRCGGCPSASARWSCCGTTRT